MLFVFSCIFTPSVCLKVLDVRVYCHSALCRQFSGELVCSGPLEAGGRGPGDWTVEAAGTPSQPTPANHSTAAAEPCRNTASNNPPYHPVLPSLGSSNLDNSPACLECHYKHDQKYPTSQTLWLLLLSLCTHKHTIIPELHHNPQLHQCRYVSRAAIVLYRASRGGFALSSLLNTNKTILN